MLINATYGFDDAFVENMKSIFWRLMFFSKSEWKINEFQMILKGLVACVFISGVLLIIDDG